MSNEVNNGSADAKHDLKYSSNPYDLFRKRSHQPEVYATGDKGSRKHKSAVSINKSQYDGNDEETYNSMIVFVERPTVLAPP